MKSKKTDKQPLVIQSVLFGTTAKYGTVCEITVGNEDTEKTGFVASIINNKINFHKDIIKALGLKIHPHMMMVSMK